MMSPSTDELTLERAEPDLPEVRFVAPVLGLEHLSSFALVQLDEESPLFSLQSLEDPRTRLLVLAPGAVFADYSPVFDAVSRAAVGLSGDDEGLLLVVVNPGETLAESTVNLLAPILVHPTTGVAAQVVLTGSDYPLRSPLAA